MASSDVFEIRPGDALPPALECSDDQTPYVALYLHGGAFLFDEDADVYANRLAATLRAPVAMLHYRTGASHPFPAATDDVFAAYQGLTAAGWPAHRILVVGHSAGATLALSLQLRLNGSSSTSPLGVVALSGVLDFTLTSESFHANDGRDSITGQQAVQVRASYLAGADAEEPLASPALATPSQWSLAAPLFLLCGGDELFRDDSVQLAQRASRGEADVTLRVVPHQQHGFAQRAVPASDRILAEVAAFARRCTIPVPDGKRSIDTAELNPDIGKE